MNLNVKKARFFFCYSEHMAFYLIKVKRVFYITEAKSVMNDKRFFLFERTDELKAALDDYHTHIKNKISIEELQEMVKE